MAVYKRGKIWWYRFIFNGRVVQQSAKTQNKTLAREGEKDHRRRLERTLVGLPAEEADTRVQSVAEVTKRYLEAYELGHREKSVLFSKGRLAHVLRLLGTKLLSEINEDSIRGYMRSRLKDGAGGRTINMELGELSRAMGRPWSVLWPKVKKLEVSNDVGRALSPKEEHRLLEAARTQNSPNRSRTLETFLRVALLTGMRCGEITSLTWGQVNFSSRVLTVGRAKTSSGTGRQIPMNPDLFAVLSAHAAWFASRFGEIQSEYCLFPFGKPTPNDPTRPITDITGAWNALRKRAGVNCRFHDLRHTVATKLAEAGVPESTMLALMGHMSRAMLERYSHIRMAAKREAVEALTLARGPMPAAETTLPSTQPSTMRVQ